MGSLGTVAQARPAMDETGVAVVTDWEARLCLDQGLFGRSKKSSCVVAHGDAARKRAPDGTRSPSWTALVEFVRLELSRGACLNTRTCSRRKLG